MSATAAPGPTPAPGGMETSPGDNGRAPREAHAHDAQRPPTEPQRRPPDESQAQGIAEALARAHAQARQQAEVGDLTGARALLEDALAAGELHLGHDHPQLAPLMVDVATIARRLGNLTEALTQLRRAYSIIVSSAGPDQATSLSIEGRLAAVMYRLGEPTEAYDWHLADVGTRVLGPDHPAVRGAQQRLATVRAQPEPPAAAGQASIPDPDWEPGLAPTFAANADSSPSDHNGSHPNNAAYTNDALHTHQADGAIDIHDDPAAAYTWTAPGVYQRRQEDPRLHASSAPPAHQPDYPDVDIWQKPTPDRGHPRPRRALAGGIALATSLGAGIITTVVIVGAQFFVPMTGGDAAATPPATTTAAPPATTPVATTPPAVTLTAAAPTVVLKDNGGSVTITWVDPSNGKVPFIVAGGRAGTVSSPVETVPRGRTTSTIYGLNVRYNYCYTVAAVWSSNMVAPSKQACTKRASATPSP